MTTLAINRRHARQRKYWTKTLPLGIVRQPFHSSIMAMEQLLDTFRLCIEVVAAAPQLIHGTNP